MGSVMGSVRCSDFDSENDKIAPASSPNDMSSTHQSMNSMSCVTDGSWADEDIQPTKPPTTDASHTAIHMQHQSIRMAQIEKELEFSRGIIQHFMRENSQLNLENQVLRQRLSMSKGQLSQFNISEEKEMPVPDELRLGISTETTVDSNANMNQTVADYNDEKLIWKKVADFSALMARDRKLKVWGGIFKTGSDYNAPEVNRISKVLRTFMMLYLTRVWCQFVV